MLKDDESFMKVALEQAHFAERLGEVPIGAVLVHEGQIIAASGNVRESQFDPTGHAELVVLREGAKKLCRWRLTGCTLYVTLEPCTMCAGALVLARVDRVVFGATDPKAGAVISISNVLSNPKLNHQPQLEGGVCAEECGKALSDFFRRKRQQL